MNAANMTPSNLRRLIDPLQVAIYRTRAAGGSTAALVNGLASVINVSNEGHWYTADALARHHAAINAAAVLAGVGG